MQIATNMNLNDLMERMGDVATQDEAELMRDLLVEQFDGQDTADVPEAAWMELLEKAVQ